MSISKKTFLIIVAVLLVSVIGNIYFFNSKDTPQDTQAIAAAKVDEIVTQVSKIMVLPGDEKPTIATVSDLSKLAGQPFFANAMVGDQVMIYATAKKAILWRPGENKIIEVAPLNVGTTGTAAAANAATSAGSKPEPKK